jgi:hypothetical protein
MEQGGMQETAFDLTKGQYIITSTPPSFFFFKNHQQNAKKSTI